MGGGGTFSPKKSLRKHPKRQLFQNGCKICSWSVLEIKKMSLISRRGILNAFNPPELKMIVACISLHLKQQDFCCFFLGTPLHSINYIVFIYSNLLQHLYILCLAGFNILISMFPFPLSSLSLYIRYFG